MRRVDGTCPECERIVALMADAGRAVSAAYKAAQEASGHDAALNAAAIAAKERKATLDDELLSHRDNHAESKIQVRRIPLGLFSLDRVPLTAHNYGRQARKQVQTGQLEHSDRTGLVVQTGQNCPTILFQEVFR